MRRILAIVLISFLAHSASAQECSTEVQVQQDEQTLKYRDLDRLVRRLESRVSSQDKRIAELPEDVAASLPEAPELPRLPTDFFDDRSRPLVECAEGGIPGVTPEIISEALEATEAKLLEAEEATKAREDALVEAEDALPPEGGDQVASEDPDTAGDDDDPNIASGEETDQTLPEDDGNIREPMKAAENEFLYRRVITLPENTLVSQPGNDDGETLPVFKVLYVFEEQNVGGQNWLEVGVSLREDSLGWIRTDDTVAWSTMMVMQFSENPRRGKVLFYGSETHLVDTVQNVNIDQEVDDIYNAIEKERRKIKQDAGYQPKWDERLVAIEPETSVRYKDKPYLLPILDYRRDEFPDGTPTTLVEVAAIPSEGRTIRERDVSSLGSTADPTATADGKLPIGIMFVMDTTISMRPYIERTKLFVEEFYEAFEANGDINNVTFGLVAFRDNVAQDNRIEYVTEIVQELDPEASKRSILANLKTVEEATVPTSGFQEDGFSGLWEAMQSPAWNDFRARIVIMITDASSREAGDLRAKYQDLTANRLADEARVSDIAIVPVHLLTNLDPADQERARQQYIQLAQGRDSGAYTYTPIDAKDAASFGEAARLLASSIAKQVTAINNGEIVDPVLEEEHLEPVPSGEFAPAGKLAAVVGNEIFRAQLETLARNSDDTAPSFLAGWASDRDLLNRSQEVLDVRVFLNRNQLSEMAQRLDIIISSYAFGDDDPAAFFNRIQNLAAEFATDPEAVRRDEALAVQEVLPGFLRNLPYRSEMLKLNFDFWKNQSQGSKETYVERLKDKQRIYQSIYDSTENWVDFGAGNPALRAYPIKLSDLP